MYKRLYFALACLLWASHLLADRCDPIDCPVEQISIPGDRQDGGHKQDPSWIIAIGDVQINDWELSENWMHTHQKVHKWLWNHRDQVAMILLVGDQRGAGSSDGSAGGITNACDADQLEDERIFREEWLEDMMGLGIPIVPSKGNHDMLDCWSQTIDADYITWLQSLPQVLAAGWIGDYQDHLYVVVDDFMGSQLIGFGMAYNEHRDDYTNCGDPGELPCGCTGVGDPCSWHNFGTEKTELEAVLDAYPTADVAIATHVFSPEERAYLEADAQFILAAAGHTIQTADIDAWEGTNKLVYVNHDNQWYLSSGNQQLTAARFDPDVGVIHVDELDARANAVMGMWFIGGAGPWGDYSKSIPYSGIAASDDPWPATWDRYDIPTSGGYLSDDSCNYAYHLGAADQRAGCNSDMWLGPYWGTGSADYASSRSGLVIEKSVPIGSDPGLSLCHKEVFYDSEGNVNKLHDFQFAVMDTNNSSTFSPDDLVVDNQMHCQWTRSFYTEAEFDALVQASTLDAKQQLWRWDTDADEFYGYYQYGVPDKKMFFKAWAATAQFDGPPWVEDQWVHLCWAWGKDALASGGTNGEIFYWVNGAKQTALSKNNDTTAFVDPADAFMFFNGDSDGFRGCSYEAVGLNLANTVSDSEADLTAITQYLCQCGVADRAQSSLRRAAYCGSGSVLGPGGETSCSRD